VRLMPTAVSPPGADSMLETLALERIEVNLFRANFVRAEEYSLYGGQVAAQALAAAAATVPAGRLPHSLHGYFLRAGEPHRPTVFRVEQDRDGRSFSARRVVAIQGGEVIFNLAASFHGERPGPVVQSVTAPAVPGPDSLPTWELPRYPAIEMRVAPGPEGRSLPTRFWARCRHPLPDDMLTHACVLAYLSDLSTGLPPLPGAAESRATSLDHALWFHRPVRLDQWVLVELEGRMIAGSRGHYTGSVFTADGQLAASLSQEMLVFTPRR
jgi:acyl-CoA thioesterase II